MYKKKITNLMEEIKKYEKGESKLDISDIIWEANVRGMDVTSSHNTVYISKGGLVLFTIGENSVDYDKNLSLFNVVESVQ